MSTLRFKKIQRQQVLNIIVKTHQLMLTGDEYDSMQEFCAGSKLIKDGSVEQQMVADLCEQGLSLSECIIIINQDYLQKDHDTITCWTVCTCKLNMVRMVSNIERCPQGNKAVGSIWVKARYRWVTQLLV